MRDDEMEKAEISEGLAEAGLASSCQFGVNEARSCVKTDADLTQARSRLVRRQLLHLSSVYQRSSVYYREALRPVIRTLLDRIDGERA